MSNKVREYYENHWKRIKENGPGWSHRYVLDLIPRLSEKLKILDVGSGNGRLAEVIEKIFNYEVTV